MNVEPSDARLRDVQLAGASPAGLVHPNIFFRVAGLPFEAVDELIPGRTFATLREILSRSADVGADVAEATAVLESAIGRDALSNEQRRQLIKLKRDIFNRRVKQAALPELAAGVLQDAESEIVGRACAAILEIAQLEVAVEAGFDEEVEQVGLASRALCLGSENFLRALAISAPKCLQDLYASQGNPKKFTGKRGRNLNSALFNYLMRAATKVSPLSYFTPIGVAGFGEGAGGSVREIGSSDVWNDVQLSRRAIDQMLSLLTRKLAFWGQDYPLTLNPTIERIDDHFQFEKLWDKGEAGPRVWGTMQPSGRVPATPAIREIVEAFEDRGGEADGSLSLAELFQRIGQSPAIPDQQTFVRLASQSLAAGLVLPALPIYDQECDLAWFVAFVSPRFPELGEELTALEAKLGEYAKAGARDRLDLSNQLRAHFAACLELLGGDAKQNAKGILFYEDCFLSDPPEAVETQSLGSTVGDLQTVSALFPMLDFTHMVQSITAALFAAKYGSGAQVRASDCIEDLAREASAFAQRVSPLPIADQREAVGKVSHNADTLLALKAEMLGEIATLLEAGENVEIDHQFVEKYANRVPGAVRGRGTSYTVIGQLEESAFAVDGRGPGFVINRLYSGHSMLASRFLAAASKEGVEAVKHYIAATASDRVPVEMPGVFGFNANLHPRFVDHEVELPGRRPNYRETEKVSLDDIIIEYDERFDRLRMVHDELGELAPFYFGFLVLMMLPSAHQLLVRTNMQGLILDLWQDLDYADHVPKDEVAVLPRVTFGSLIMMRRSIFVPASAQPDPGLDELGYYRAFHQMLEDLGEGYEFFVRLVADQDDIIGGQEGLGGMGETTDFKPSYLSMMSPPTIASLQRRLRRRPRRILLQEALPALHTNGVEWNGMRHACELQIEISTKNHGRKGDQ